MNHPSKHLQPLFALLIANASMQTAIAASREQCPITPDASYDVVEQSIDGDNVYGLITRPKDCSEQQAKVVIVLGGSEGGIPAFVARRLASHGLTAIAVAYFGVPSSTLPAAMDLVPLDVVDDAFAFATRRFSEVKCCAVLAGSKGAEAALAYLSMSQRRVLGLVSIAGSGIAFEGLSLGNGSSGHSAWTYKGENLAYVPYDEMEGRGISRAIVESILRDPQQLVPGYGGRVCYQSVLRMRGKSYLVRVVIDEQVEPSRVITVYRTSQIKRYWRES